MNYSFEDLIACSKHIRAVRTLGGHAGVVRSVAFSPDGRSLASASNDKTVRLWDVQTGHATHTLQGHDDMVNSVAFSPDGDWLASGSNDGTIRLWESETGRTINTLQLLGLDNYVMSVVFAPDGRSLASGSNDGTIRLWESQSGRVTSILQGHSEPVIIVAFAPDGRSLASGSNDGTIRLWEIESGRTLQILTPSKGRVSTLAWSPDGELLVSRSDDGSVSFWHVTSGQRISVLHQAGSAPIYWNVSILAFSSDGRFLTTYPPDTLNAIQLWDISAFDIRPTPPIPTQKAPVALSTPREFPLRMHLHTLPFCHVTAPNFSLTRSASWLRCAVAAGWSLPLALAHDLGLLLCQPGERLTLAKPAYLPFDEDTSAYLAFLQRVADHPLVQELASWQPPLADTILSVLLARLIEGTALSDHYRAPAGLDGVRFVQVLTGELVYSNPARLWQEMTPAAHISWRNLLSAGVIARLESNLNALDREELRFLIHYGPPLPGSPDPRTLLDLLALTGLPVAARLALSQTLQLLPHFSTSRDHGGIQIYPEGGYEGLAHQGSLESLLPTEMAYPDDLFLHRVLNHEALYYGRERPREQRRELVYLVGQLGWGLGGDGQVLVRTLLLALGQTMRQRGYEVCYSLAGSTLSPPRPLDKPEEVGRLLYAQEQGCVDSELVLRGVLEYLHSWRELYRERQVLWVLSEDFDRDGAEEHAEYYQALQAEGEQRVWYIHVGSKPTLSEPHRISPLPATAHHFARWQTLESSSLWDPGKAVRT